MEDEAIAFYRRRDARTVAETDSVVLPPSVRVVCVDADPYATQATLTVLASLLPRFCRDVTYDVPSSTVHPQLRHPRVQATELPQALVAASLAIDPHGRFTSRRREDATEFVLAVGRPTPGADFTVNAAGWRLEIGTDVGPSEIAPTHVDDMNPVAAAFAASLAAADIYLEALGRPATERIRRHALDL